MNEQPANPIPPIVPAASLVAATAAKFQNLVDEKNAGLEAQATPLPGPLLPAFTAGPIKIDSYSIRPIVKADYRHFQQTDNAVLKWLSEAAKPKEERTAVADDPISDNMLVWQLTHDPHIVEKELKAGVEAFKIKCTQETEYSMPPHIYDLLLTAAWEQISRSQITVLRFIQKESEGENGDPFTVLTAIQESHSQS